MRRDRQPELMDQPDVDPAAHAHALRSLNFANRRLGVDRSLYRHVRSVGFPANGALLDLGAGGGGFLQYLYHRHAPDRPTLLALDISPFALHCAYDWLGGAVRAVTANALKIPLRDGSVDVVTCSLFLHHFDPPEAIAILREARRVARRGVVVGDLSRSRLAWILTWLTTHVVSRSPIFHVDGPRSVSAAWRPRELAEMAEEAGLRGAVVRRAFPFRLILTWRRSEPSDAGR